MPVSEVISPLPGTFYRKPSPDGPPFKSEGDTVTAEDVIGLVEVMKSFYEIKAGVAGVIIKFLADHEEPVMSGQTVAEIKT